jgi:membrane-associated protease RseP (regulator of RpoE activity)
MPTHLPPLPPAGRAIGRETSRLLVAGLAFLTLIGPVRADAPGPSASPSAAAPIPLPASSAATTASPLGLHPVLGVQIDMNAQTDGLLVDAVLPGSIAGRLGLEPGDILLELNGKALPNIDVLHQVLSGLAHGDVLVLRWRHGSQVVEKKDNLDKVPVLPSYQLVEGKGIPGVIEIGYTRQQLEKALGKAAGEQKREGVTYLAYPFHGITVALLEGGGALRVLQFSVEYPLVVQTARGVNTSGPRDAIDVAYKGEAIDRRLQTNEMLVETIPALGIQFRSLGGRIRRVSIIPKPRPGETAPGSKAQGR